MKRGPRLQIFVTGVLWALLSAFLFLHSHSPRRGGFLAGLAALFIISSLFIPALARALHRFLSGLIQGIVSVITWTLLGLVYFLIMSPLGLLLRATGSLRTARNARRSLESYWFDRRPEPVSAERYLRPF